MISVNGEKINSTIFPDQTSQVWRTAGLTGLTAKVVWEFELEREFMQLAQLKTLLDKRGIKATLHMPYLPYARQDKPVSNETTFALTTFAQLLNSLKFDQVFCLDPHSEVPKELIKNFTVIYPIRYILMAQHSTNPDVFCYPDSGALHKYVKYTDEKYVYADKVRNQETGQLESMELVGDVDGKSVLIVDDICDGGGTFCWLTQILLEKGATEVNLYTTHGIFSKGLKPLKEAGINRIFTRNGEISQHQNNICYRSLKTEL